MHSNFNLTNFRVRIFSWGTLENLFTRIFNTWIFSYTKISRFTVYTATYAYEVLASNNTKWSCGYSRINFSYPLWVSQVLMHLMMMYPLAVIHDIPCIPSLTSSTMHVWVVRIEQRSMLLIFKWLRSCNGHQLAIHS